MKNALLIAAVALGAVAFSSAAVSADDRPAPPIRNPGTTDRPGSGGDLKGTTTSGTTTTGTTRTGQTLTGTTTTGTTTRAGSGTAAGMTVGSSSPGTPGAAHAGAAADLAGHGKNKFWNETYYGRGLAGYRLVRTSPAGVLVASDTSAPANGPSGGTVRAAERDPALITTPTSYVEPAPRGPLVVGPAAPGYGGYSSRTWYGPATGAFAGASVGRGSFGGTTMYSGYETWGPVGISGGCDCR